MTVEYFNSLSYSEQERLVMQEATVVEATVGKESITLICDLNNFRFSASIDLQHDIKVFCALGEKQSVCNIAHSRNTSLLSTLHMNWSLQKSIKKAIHNEWLLRFKRTNILMKGPGQAIPTAEFHELSVDMNTSFSLVNTEVMKAINWSELKTCEYCLPHYILLKRYNWNKPGAILCDSGEISTPNRDEEFNCADHCYSNEFIYDHVYRLIFSEKGTGKTKSIFEKLLHSTAKELIENLFCNHPFLRTDISVYASLKIISRKRLTINV